VILLHTCFIDSNRLWTLKDGANDLGKHFCVFSRFRHKCKYVYTYIYRIQIYIDIYEYMDIFVPVHKCVYVSIYIGFYADVWLYLSIVPQTMCVLKVHIHLCAIYTYVSRSFNICVDPQAHVGIDLTICMYESKFTYGWVMSHFLMSHCTYLNESWFTCKWVLADTWMSHVHREICLAVCGTWMAKLLDHIYERIIGHIWISHLSHMCTSGSAWQFVEFEWPSFIPASRHFRPSFSGTFRHTLICMLCCAHLCMFVIYLWRIYTYMCVYIYTHTRALYLHIYIQVSECMYLHIIIHNIYIDTRIYTHVYICTNAHIHIQLYIQESICMNIYIYLYVNICIYVYIYICKSEWYK